MSLLSLLKEFASACINRTEAEIHEAAAAIESHFHGKVEAPVEAVAAQVEAAPAEVAAAVSADIASATDEVQS